MKLIGIKAPLARMMTQARAVTAPERAGDRAAVVGCEVESTAPLSAGIVHTLQPATHRAVHRGSCVRPAAS